jgi:uncharacterized membrane protein YfcA
MASNRDVDVTQLLAVAAVGLVVGFLGGVFGKGGSAVATPLLAAIGVPAIAAVASPLPAVVPATFVSARQYARRGHVDRWLLVRGALVGLPAAALGAFATHWIGGVPLVVATDVLLLALGLRFLVAPGEPHEVARDVPHEGARAIGVALAVGFVSGLLANGGGVLFAPLFVLVLHRSLKDAFGTSAALATLLAVPGTIVHAALGHIDWSVTLVFAATSIPAPTLQRVYGVALATLGAALLALTA